MSEVLLKDITELIVDCPVRADLQSAQTVGIEAVMDGKEDEA